MSTPVAPNSRPKLALRKAEFDTLMDELHCHTDVAKAEFLGLSRTALMKIRLGRQEPSPAFIAALKHRFPRVPLERFLTTETPVEHEADAA